MRFPLTMLPNVINSMVEANISLQRLNKFLLGKELDPNVVKKLNTDDKAPAIELKGPHWCSHIPLLIFQIRFRSGGTFHWAKDKSVLKDINLVIPKGSLCAVVGEVGSGTLLYPLFRTEQFWPGFIIFMILIHKEHFCSLL